MNQLDALARGFVDSAIAEIDLAVRFMMLARLDAARLDVHLKSAEDACLESRRQLEMLQLPALPAETVRQRLVGLRGRAAKG